ncbi:Endopolyphosphatase [Dothidotthia symphoricarpi CBS 119687]|uniref:Endopolyphosphatase n=1 Tax=Dothidotthia symphoricarpi CBS 119687 TaxID=1392245 RepID=A0A6A6AK06_9PLEO|nr:Endopolyphosphatase [Dothidotthia symphoricarpi CBS 119687]KAF2131438.1 Endopolyphosphatase [Dothidotthia symphoricarpi CBS 119687]
MLHPRDALICGLLLWGTPSSAAPPSADLNREAGNSDAAGRRRLTGRFLHITDFHPDPFYKTYSSTTAEATCHRQRGPAGLYGAETSGCDSPFSLINETFKWINDHVKDDVDFVVWTGDSARHDNDEALPRTQKQVIQQNEFLVSKFAEVFGQKDHDSGRTDGFAIPVVPTFGNNDIMPHNIMLQGPSKWTKKYLDIWRNFIPEEQRHQFQQGGWFSVEVIPGKLAVVSLNTLYFFTSNSATDGCANKREPGYEHMEWLRIQLQIMRDRGMKAILMGHVPPARVGSKSSWDETCWQKYTLWQRQYRDVIVGSLYGHMNIDHFMLQDFEHIDKDTENGRMANSPSQEGIHSEIGLLEDGELTVASASDYLLGLREAWAQLPSPPAKSDKKSRSGRRTFDDDDDDELSIWEWLVSKVSDLSNRRKPGQSDKQKYLEKIGGRYAERYSSTLVAPSVVPNYFPTLRIIEYNITGLEHIRLSPLLNNTTQSPLDKPSTQSPLTDHAFDHDAAYKRDISAIQTQKNKKKHTPHKGPRKYKFKLPAPPSPASPPGPAYSPQSLTWTRYTQYFANLTHINNDFLDPKQNTDIDANESPNARAPHTIFGLALSSGGKIENTRWKEGKHGKHQGKQPRPEPHPNPFKYEIEYDTKRRGFPDLTVRRWVEYARRIGSGAAAEMNEGMGEVEVDGGKKHKHKHKHADSKEWFTFVRRAFVGTMDPREIKEVFGRAGRAEMQSYENGHGLDTEEQEEEEEVMEL